MNIVIYGITFHVNFEYFCDVHSAFTACIHTMRGVYCGYTELNVRVGRGLLRGTYTNDERTSLRCIWDVYRMSTILDYSDGERLVGRQTRNTPVFDGTRYRGASTACGTHALIMHGSCTTRALLMHYSCTAHALLMHCSCIARALLVHCSCTARALLVECSCIARALLVHCSWKARALLVPPSHHATRCQANSLPDSPASEQPFNSRLYLLIFPPQLLSRELIAEAAAKVQLLPRPSPPPPPTPTPPPGRLRGDNRGALTPLYDTTRLPPLTRRQVGGFSCLCLTACGDRSQTVTSNIWPNQVASQLAS